MKANAWLIIKAIFVLVSILMGASVISDLRDEELAPPLWIGPIVCSLGFLMGVVARTASRTPPWTERALWQANPFRRVFSLHDKQGCFDPPWVHLGALSFIGAGAGAFAFAVSSRPAMIGHAATILGGGIGIWLGLRLRDLVRRKNVETATNVS